MTRPVEGGALRLAYADPPYVGRAHMYPERTEVDQPALIRQLVDEFPDGWALSLSSPSLRDLLPLCPPKARVLAWVKPFASFKPGQTLSYSWEPVILVGGRRRPRSEPTVRDFVSANITLRKGLAGAKPREFNEWLLDCLGVMPGDDLVELYPGTGGLTEAWRARMHQIPLELERLEGAGDG